jgi:hypothetical protein
MVERFVIHTSQGFHVIEGRKLNREPLSRAIADRLAAPAAVRPPVRANPPIPAAEPALPDLSPTEWDAAGGSCGFEIRGWAR